MFQRNFPGKLGEVLEYLNKNHLAKILFRGATRPMRTHQLRDQRVKFADQPASCLIVMLERSLNQRACIRIIHVVEIESTPTVMTGGGTFGLQLCGAQIERKYISASAGLELALKKCNRTSLPPVITCETRALKRARRNQTKNKMKRNLLTLFALVAIAGGGFALAQGPDQHDGGPG